MQAAGQWCPRGYLTGGNVSVISAHAGSLLISGAPAEFLYAEAVRAAVFTGTEYRIADPALCRLDPTANPYVEVSPTGDTDPSAWQPINAYVDPLFGTVLLLSDPGPLAIVRVSGYSLPAYQLALVRALSISISNDVVELQVFGDGYKRRAVTLRDFSGELSGLSLTPTDIDPGPSLRSLDDALANGTPLLIEAGKGSGAEVFRAWVKVPELSHKLTPGSLYEHTVKFVGFPFPGPLGSVVAWGYGNP